MRSPPQGHRHATYISDSLDRRILHVESRSNSYPNTSSHVHCRKTFFDIDLNSPAFPTSPFTHTPHDPIHSIGTACKT